MRPHFTSLKRWFDTEKNLTIRLKLSYIVFPSSSRFWQHNRNVRRIHRLVDLALVRACLDSGDASCEYTSACMQRGLHHLLALPRNSLSLSLSRTELEHELRAAMAMNAPADERPVCWRLYSLDLAPGTMEHRGYK